MGPSVGSSDLTTFIGPRPIVALRRASYVLRGRYPRYDAEKKKQHGTIYRILEYGPLFR